MEVKLNRGDLKKYFDKMNLDDIQYKHLNWKAKKLVRIADTSHLYETNGNYYVTVIAARFTYNFYSSAIAIFILLVLFAALKSTTPYECFIRSTIALILVLFGIL
jgi:hypothetical protein